MYTKITPEEILGKFVSGRMMVKEARYVDDALNGPLPVYEPQLALQEICPFMTKYLMTRSVIVI
jgi:hypothetical protein